MGKESRMKERGNIRRAIGRRSFSKPRLRQRTFVNFNKIPSERMALVKQRPVIQLKKPPACNNGIRVTTNIRVRARTFSSDYL